MYGYESNISRIIEVYEQLLNAKQLGHHVLEYYANICGLLTQLELYQPDKNDLMTQRCCREDLTIAIFLVGLDNSTSSILREAHLLTVAKSFSSTI